jgi:hypothetical protein
MVFWRMWKRQCGILEEIEIGALGVECGGEGVSGGLAGLGGGDVLGAGREKKDGAPGPGGGGVREVRNGDAV